MCVLLVEDEAVIRTLVAELLVEAGFEVREACNGDVAAALIEQLPLPFSLLVTDINMPGSLNGIGVARLMRQRHPAVPVIYTTGRPDVLHDAAQHLKPDELLIRKPYFPSVLVKAARQLLVSGSGNPAS